MLGVPGQGGEEGLCISLLLGVELLVASHLLWVSDLWKRSEEKAGAACVWNWDLCYRR